jgi:hypothetical protein
LVYTRVLKFFWKKEFQRRMWEKWSPKKEEVPIASKQLTITARPARKRTGRTDTRDLASLPR